MSTKTLYQGRKIGELVEDTVFKYVRRSKHWCRRHSGWGFQADAVRDWLKQGATQFVVVDLDNDEAYVADTETLMLRGIVDTLNERDGEQIFLEAGYFEVIPNWSERRQA